MVLFHDGEGAISAHDNEDNKMTESWTSLWKQIRWYLLIVIVLISMLVMIGCWVK